MVYKRDYENISLKPATKERLKALAKYGDTMDDVVNRRLDVADQHEADAQ